MAKKIEEPKQIIEREYVIPLRREWLKVPEYKRTNKAIKAIKEFLVRHMKIYDRDLRKIKIDILLNNEIRFRGIKKPYSKIKVKARKFDNDIVRVELVDIPKHIKFAKLREEKLKEKIIKEDKKAEEVKETEEKEKLEEKIIGEAKEEKKESEEVKEKEETSKEAEMQLAKQKAKEQKHISKDKKVQVFRRALKK